MPVLNGFELCKKIRAIDNIVHIIFITAAEEYYKFRHQHFPELGKINYIQKPIGNDELVQIVDRIVAKFQLNVLVTSAANLTLPTTF